MIADERTVVKYGTKEIVCRFTLKNESKTTNHAREDGWCGMGVVVWYARMLVLFFSVSIKSAVGCSVPCRAAVIKESKEIE
jgi:purine-cytosine permease-like protein